MLISAASYIVFKGEKKDETNKECGKMENAVGRLTAISRLIGFKSNSSQAERK